MSTTVVVKARNMELTQKLEDYVNKKAGRLEKFLPLIEEAVVELAHHKSARSASDRHVAQITVRGKGVTLRTEERADEALAAFDAALDHLQRQIERYKGKHYHGRGDGRPSAEVAESAEPAEPAEDRRGVIARRKKFMLGPMNVEEAIEQMKLLAHNNFFVFYNGGTNNINVLYRRRDGTYGLIEPELG